MEKPISRTIQFVSAIAFVLLISISIFYWLMHPPMSDLGHMAQFLSLTAVISILVGYGAYRLGWMERAPSLRWAVLGSYLLASLLTFLNVWITARLMFASQHDLILASVLLIFAGGIAVAFGSFFASALSERISRLKVATQEIENGNLAARAQIEGSDEIASLAQSFNKMAEKLQIAEQKQKELEALRRDLVAWAGHDLRTPLASIRLLIEALADGVVTDPETVKGYLSQAKKQVDSLSLLVDDLFQVSQLDAGGLPLALEPASLSDLISDTLESFSNQASLKGISLSGSAEPGIDPVTMDVQRMGRVLNNLFSNALRYTPSGGQINILAVRAENGVLVSISDTGEGIAPADLPHIFERFYRGEKSRSRQRGGSGLGLAIAKGIIDAHKGYIKAESEQGKGTTFTFFLPKG
jgi:signal transduction histidine kinase